MSKWIKRNGSRHRIVSVLRARDGLLGAEEVAERDVYELRGVAEFTPLGSGFAVPGDRGNLAGLLGVVRSQ
ncbi:hypothetical protein GCM10011583_71480 [Streptomyces camponoticapitis]|uniref:Uncharacterized protein n=1 Tax=Streptomyces camponoticapitis TaxID=1616125 RepID=A0ABQ2F009_9ACTN|nr:hypothetical protein GCM10011583_71480 [Streptomyces camponoticapitis]